MWYLIVSIPDLCTLTYIEFFKFRISEFQALTHQNAYAAYQNVHLLKKYAAYSHAHHYCIHKWTVHASKQAVFKVLNRLQSRKYYIVACVLNTGFDCFIITAGLDGFQIVAISFTAKFSFDFFLCLA